VDELIRKNNQGYIDWLKHGERFLKMSWWERHFESDVHLRYGFESPVLDVGCGGGEKSIIFARSGLDVYAFDASPVALEIFRGHYADEPADVQERVHFCLADIRDTWPYPDDAFATVHFSHALEHLPPIHNSHAVAECQRVVRPGGQVLIIVPEGTAYGMGVHEQFLSTQDMWEIGAPFECKEITVADRCVHLIAKVVKI